MGAPKSRRARAFGEGHGNEKLTGREREDEGDILDALPVSDEWRWTDEQGVQRVVRADELRSALASSVLAPSTLVWREGMTGWVPAFTVPELGESEGPASEATSDATTNVARGGVEPPPLVQPNAVVPHDTADTEKGSAIHTGRPTPTELLGEKNGVRAAREKAATEAARGGASGMRQLKIGAAPRPIVSPAPRPVGNVESGTSPSKLGIPRATAASPWRKTEGGKTKADDELTLVADGVDPFKLKSASEAGSNGASAKGASGSLSAGAVAAKITPSPPALFAKAGDPSPQTPGGRSPVAASLQSRRPVTHTAVLSPNDQSRPAAMARPAAGRPPSIVPPPPVPIVSRRNPSTVPPPDGARKAPSTSPPPAKPGENGGNIRATAVLGSRTASPGASVSIPLAPGAIRPTFNIVENTSTDSTGVLPLSGQYAAEPKGDRAGQPSYVEGAPEFAHRMPSFPDAARSGESAPQGNGSANGEAGRPAMRSQPSQGPEQQGYAPAGYAPNMMQGYSSGYPSQASMPSASFASYPPAPGSMLGMDAHINAQRMEAEARAGQGFAAPRIPLRSEPPQAPVILSSAPSAEGASAGYNTSPPPLAAASDGSFGEIRVTGAMALVNPKRSSAAAAGVTNEGATNEPAEPTGKVGDSVIVPLSSLFGAGAILIAMAISAFFVGRCSAGPGPVFAPARPALAALPQLARAGIPAVPKPCWMAKQPVRWAKTVLQSIPVDVAPTPSGVVVAYAQSPHDLATVEVDFAAATYNDKPGEKIEEDIVRVFAPREGGGAQATTKGDKGPLAPFVISPGAKPFFVGVAGKGTQAPSVSVAEKPEEAPSELWSVPAVEEDKGLDAARLLGLAGGKHALVFRRAGNILGGFISAENKADGGLGVVAGSGGSVGKPSLGSNGRELAVVFADKATSDGTWEIRVGHAPLGQVPRESAVVPLPKGGPGGDAFAPDVAGTADGRWVLVWTEGQTGAYAVRAQTFGVDWKPLGDPIAISPPAGNFGQAVVGAFGNYVTTMFLSKGVSGSYELWGAVLQCGS